MEVLVITDNDYLYKNFLTIINDGRFLHHNFNFRFSPISKELLNKYHENSEFLSMDLKQEWPIVIDSYDLVISLHSKQIFPKSMVESIRCINIHPGYNPFNRGWYPQVFSIINKLPIGVTIHEMDEYLDHGPIIARKEIEIFAWETSFDVYSRIIQEEIQLIDKYLLDIITNNYVLTYLDSEGNVNLKKDFNSLCKIDLSKRVTMGEAIDFLRAVTFPKYRNAYFIKNGEKIYVELNLTRE